MHAVMPVVRWIDDRQEGRERPIIYVGMDALKDSWDKPLSSSQKTLRKLLETYQLFFVAGAPQEPHYYEETVKWLEQYVNVPAWGHTVFTNQRELLYGDYFVGRETDWEGMATHIDFGSDTFKTWDIYVQPHSRQYQRLAHSILLATPTWKNDASARPESPCARQFLHTPPHPPARRGAGRRCRNAPPSHPAHAIPSPDRAGG